MDWEGGRDGHVCLWSRGWNYNNILLEGHQINRLQMDIQEEGFNKEFQKVFDFTLKTFKYFKKCSKTLVLHYYHNKGYSSVTPQNLNPARID